MGEPSQEQIGLDYDLEESKENIKANSTAEKLTSISCDYCRSDCKWVKQKSSEIPDTYKCDRCPKSYSNFSRYHCSCQKTGYNVCAECSQIASLDKCGCQSPLVFETDLIRNCCWCDTKINEKGWKCSAGCKYAICLYCKPRVVVQTKKNSDSMKSKEQPKTPVSDKKEVKVQESPQNSMKQDNKKKMYKKLDCLGHGTFGLVYKCLRISDQVWR